MPIGLLFTELALGLGIIAWARDTRQRSLLVAGCLVLAGTAIAVARDGLRAVVIAGPVTGSLALLASVVAFICWATVLGLPRPLARVLGIGLRSRVLAFSNRLLELEASFVEDSRTAQREPDRRDSALASAGEHVAAMWALQPPDPAWGVLRDDLAAACQARVEVIRDEAPPEDFKANAQAVESVRARWRVMSDEEALAQRRLATPERQRRGWALSGVATGVCFVLVGIATARAYDLSARGPADPETIFAVGTLVGGSIAVVASIVSLARAEPGS